MDAAPAAEAGEGASHADHAVDVESGPELVSQQPVEGGPDRGDAAAGRAEGSPARPASAGSTADSAAAAGPRRGAVDTAVDVGDAQKPASVDHQRAVADGGAVPREADAEAAAGAGTESVGPSVTDECRSDQSPGAELAADDSDTVGGQGGAEVTSSRAIEPGSAAAKGAAAAGDASSDRGDVETPSSKAIEPSSAAAKGAAAAWDASGDRSDVETPSSKAIEPGSAAAKGAAAAGDASGDRSDVETPLSKATEAADAGSPASEDASAANAACRGEGDGETEKTEQTEDRDIALVTLDSDSDEANGRGRGDGAAPAVAAAVRIPRCCINADCKSRDGLLAAVSTDLAYYRMVHGDSDRLPDRVWADGRRVKICPGCRLHVEKYYQVMSDLVKAGRPLLEGAVRQKEDEVCLDSDGEDEKDTNDADDDGSSGDDSSVSMIEVDSDLEEQIQAAMTAIKVDDQLDKCIQWVRDKQSAIDESFNKTERELARLDKDVHYLYEDLYKERPPTRALPSVDIFHTGAQRTIRYPDGRTYDLDPAWTASHQRHDGAPAMPPPGPLQPRPPPLVPKPGLVAGRGRAAGPAGSAVASLEKAVGDIMISDVVQVGHSSQPVDLPPLGTILRPQVKPGQHMFAMHSNTLSPWFKAKVKDVVVKQNMIRYRVKFDSPRVSTNKNQMLEGSQVAYMVQSTVRLHVGVRVVAAFRDHEQQTPTFYSGTIAEAPKAMNGYRYLIFFDDGYAAYVQHRELKLVVQPSKKVSDDVHPDCREFVAKYLAQFPERPMVKLQGGQVVKTEWNGKWWPARVAEVDASLVRMAFESEKRSEWIYRGSTRLAPMYAELVPHQPRKLGTGARRNFLNAYNVGKKNRVYVEYTRHSEREDVEPADDTGAAAAAAAATAAAAAAAAASASKESRTPRAVARKSTTPTAVDAAASPTPSQSESESPRADQLVSPISPLEGDGQITEISNKPRVTPRRLQPHICSRACIRNFNIDMNHLKGYNPLLMPMMSGWIREIVRHRTSKRTVLYRAPCGRRLRSLAEVFTYLRLTDCKLEIDCFCFDFWVHCFTEFEPARKFCSIKDVSYGKENVPVSCVNSLDRDYPDYVEYSTRRLPTRGVQLNLDCDFLTCCDCTDDCQDKAKCSCWQSTIQGTEFGPTGQLDDSAGYHFRRLVNGNVITGIYECNDRCRCQRSCLNRVCQHPLRLRLQVFKTLRRGWGIRCLDDIPKGGFICVYAGQLLTESGANEDGKNYGDEYLAELDYIEVLERLKEGYESDVVEDEESSDEKRDDDKSDEDPSPSPDDDVSGDGEQPETARRRKKQDDDFVPRKTVGGSSEQDLRRSGRSRNGKADADQPETNKKKTTISKNVETKKTASSEKSSEDNGKSGSKKTGPGSGRLSLPDEDYKSVREQFGADEYCYIMDAKTIGNLGRYLNHSCSPNVFVQNVFVDTHDLRFPWVAFFALSYIRAGTELTWDYNYEVGSVPDKVMYCHCGSQECRGRLL